MPNVNLGHHFDGFVLRQVESGRFQNASEVVRAGLRLVEDQETALAERRAELKSTITEAFGDSRPSVPASEVFTRLRTHHGKPVKADGHGG